MDADLCGICGEREPAVKIVERGLAPDPPFFPNIEWNVCRGCDQWLRAPDVKEMTKDG